MKHKIIGLVAIVILLLGIFVWPTRYRYTEMKVGNNVSPVRIDRLTGRTEVLSLSSGWHQLGVNRLDASIKLPDSELSKLTGKASITDQRIECDIYNGSNWTVSEVTVKITIKNPDGTEDLTREYRLTPQYIGNCAPLTSRTFDADLGFSLKEKQTFSLNIVSAKGTKK